MRVLVTGAAGFIGAAVVDALRGSGHEVLGLDAWIPQAHGSDLATQDRGGTVHADVRDPATIIRHLAGVDVVCHQAAMVGAGVTPADLPHFASHNDVGTATLLAAMAESGVDRLVLASSMVVYGDGRYSCTEHGPQPARPRTLADLGAGRFEVACAVCAAPMEWELVDEDARLSPRSSYAASKVAQEHYVAAWTRQVPGAAIALRYHNVYGPRMPRDTPYSGVAAIFRSAIERGLPPRVFEDGQQVRDFVHVSDVARANVLAVERVGSEPPDSFAAYNVCSGHPVNIAAVAGLLARGTRGSGQDLTPVPTGEFRAGDVRHIVASAKRASRDLGFVAKVHPSAGLPAFASAPLRE